MPSLLVCGFSVKSFFFNLSLNNGNNASGRNQNIVLAGYSSRSSSDIFIPIFLSKGFAFLKFSPQPIQSFKEGKFSGNKTPRFGLILNESIIFSTIYLLPNRFSIKYLRHI